MTFRKLRAAWDWPLLGFWAVYIPLALDVIHLPDCPVLARPFVGLAAGFGFLAGLGHFARRRPA